MATIAEKNVLVVLVDVSQFYELSQSSEDQCQFVCALKGSSIVSVLYHSLQLSFQQCIDHVIVFINSYLLSSHCNSVAVILCHQAGR